MESPVMFVLILAMITFATAPVYSQTISASQNPIIVGNNVTLSSQINVTTGAWLFDSSIIVLIIPGGPIMFEPWTSRITFNSNNSSLTIRSLQLEDSGLYTLQSVDFAAHLDISVQVPISGVTLKASATNLVESNSTVVLMCSVSNGTSLNFVWLKNNTVVAANERYQLSDEGATLTIAGVKRNEEGPFRCNVSNGVSQEISNPVTLNISYGPSDTMMMAMPMMDTYRTGSNITLSCSAKSSPPASIQWMLDGVDLNSSGPKLQLESVEENNSGNYQCLFHNTVTLRFNTASATIRIVAPLAAVGLYPTGGPAILEESFTLHCEVNGTVDNIQWWRNGKPISTDNTTVFEMANKTLILNPVQLSDNGKYQCKAFNAVSNMTSSPYTVEVSYGPMEPVIDGPSMALAGKQVIFNCSSASHPPSHISWYFNDHLMANTSVLKIENLTPNMTGKYICKAFNDVTGKNSTAYTMLTVLVPVTMAAIKIGGPQPILNHTFTLTCETAGSVESILWLYNGFPLYPGNTRNLSMDNVTLTFDPVMFSDNGNYTCEASNPLSRNNSGIFMLDVYYGPKMPTIVGPKVAKTGDNVTFSCNASSNPLSSYKWYFNGTVMVATTAEYVSPPLTIDMSGMYTCVAYNNKTGKDSTAYTMLTVVDPVTNAQVETPMNPAIEGHLYMLTCNVTGHAEHVYWMKNDQYLHEDNRTQFYMNNMTIKFNPLERNDSGSYQCMAFNAFGNATSPLHMLHVKFGPGTPIIYGPAYAETGSKVVFNCSAKSQPPSHFSWWFNGSEVANTSVFETDPLSKNMSGEYTCMAYNNKTGKNSTAYTMLTVVDPVTNAQVETPMNPAIEGHLYMLTCNVTGDAEHVYWMKNDQPLHEDNRTHFYMNNMTIKFNPLERNDSGSYQCMAFNAFGNATSPPHMLHVKFGPGTPIIDGPAYAETGSKVVFNCSAKSQPPSHFSWWFDGSEVANTPVFETDLLSLNMSGEYTCMAYNNITGKNSTNSMMLTVIEKIKSLRIRNNSVPINTKNLTLTCEVDGPYDSIYWMKNYTRLDMNHSAARNTNMSYHMENNMLFFTPVTIYNYGTYRCVATNKARSHESGPYMLLVNYGPLNVTITGPDSAKLGFTVSLTCSADSRPDCDFSWYINSPSSPVVHTGSVLTFPALASGNFICKARNPVTNITMSQTKAFTALNSSPMHIPSQGGLMLMGLLALSVNGLFN